MFIFKLILWFFLLALILQRIYYNFKSSNHVQDLKKLLLEDPQAKYQIADQVAFLVLKKTMTNTSGIIWALQNHLPPKIDRFEIDLCMPLDASSFIILTTCTYSYPVGGSDVDRVDDICFKIVADSQTSQVFIYSTIYENNTQKSLRYNFAKGLLEALQ